MARPKSLTSMKPSKGGAYSAKSVRPFRVESDPIPQSDAAGCVVCGHQRPAVAVAHRDPFCRRPCCETYYLGDSVSADRSTREVVG